MSPEHMHNETTEQYPIDLIMTAEEYAMSGPHVEDGANYEYTITTPDKCLSYVGAHHSFDPEDSFFADLEARFAAHPPTSVFVEGNPNINGREKEAYSWLRTLSREEVIHDGGESLFTLWLAAKYASPEKEIRAYSPEPDFVSEIQEIERAGHTREDILSYHIYRQLRQYLDSGGSSDASGFKADFQNNLESFGKIPGWNGAETLRLGTEVIESINFASPQSYEDLSNPIPGSAQSWTSINDVAKATSRLRDEHIVQGIIEHADAESLVVYGYSHAIMQEAALKEAFKEQRATPLG